MSYTIGGQRFATKRDVRAHASAVLNRTGLGEVMQGEDELFTRELLAQHPRVAQKHGVGVAAITVAVMPEWGTRNFLVLREDGSVDNWSIKKCITNRSEEHTSELQSRGHLVCRLLLATT